MTIRWFFGALYAVFLAGCGNSDRPEQMIGSQSAQNTPPLNTELETVRKVIEITYQSSLQEIIDAYASGNSAELQPRHVEEFEYGDNGLVKYQTITAYRENVKDESSVVPRDGAMAFEMTYTYDPLSPQDLVHYQQMKWGYWWDGDDGELELVKDVNFIREDGELVTLDDLTTTYDGQASTSREIRELVNSDGRTEHIEIYSDIDPEAQSPILDSPSFIEYYTYEGDLVVQRSRVDISGEIGGFKHSDTYTYDSNGGLRTHTREIYNDYRPHTITVFEHVVVNHEEYGRIYARVAGTQYVDAFGEAHSDSVKVTLYEKECCEPHNSDLVGQHNPQWAGCWELSAWGD